MNANASAPALLAAMRAGTPPPCVRPLPALAITPPPSLRSFASLVFANRDEALKTLLLNHPPVTPEEEVEPYLSGPLDRQFLPEPAAADFFARLHPVSYTHLTLPTICSV